jgi:hypothetical protein
MFHVKETYSSPSFLGMGTPPKVITVDDGSVHAEKAARWDGLR